MTTILKFINDDEALRIALNLEKEGYNFYIEASKQIKNPKAKQMFKRLAEAEQKHLVHFDDLRARLHAKKGQIPWGEDDELVSAYVRSLVSTGVFTASGKKSSATKKNISEEQACRIGIQTERDSILFFDEASRLCRDRRGRKMFKSLIDEEKQHLTDLARHLNQLKKK
ncbi:MAG: ferritin family protein [Planctomycetes bacterium]|nr:ferritin family protein [Planctomycetota bacterium]